MLCIIQKCGHMAVVLNRLDGNGNSGDEGGHEVNEDDDDAVADDDEDADDDFSDGLVVSVHDDRLMRQRK